MLRPDVSLLFKGCPSCINALNKIDYLVLKVGSYIPPPHEVSFLKDYNVYKLAIFAILMHVVLYNVTERLEYSKKVFTKIFGKLAINVYTLLILTSSLFRNYLILFSAVKDIDTYHASAPRIVSGAALALMFIGVILNIWVFMVLGYKGVYNQASFGYLFDKPITTGPFRLMDDPQYTGTSLFFLGFGLLMKSEKAIYLSLLICIAFVVSLEFEKKQMERIYSDAAAKKKSSSKKNDNKSSVDTTKLKKTS